MTSSSTEFHKIWIEQCAATENIRERFGLKNALDYLIGEKLFTFVTASEQNPDFAAELPAFVTTIRRLFEPGEIREYLDHLERTKYLAPPEPDLEIDDLDDETEEEPGLEKPRSGRSGVVAFFPSPATLSTVEVQPTQAMAKPKRDPIREERIYGEAIVDAYGPEEQAMGWCNYLENKMRFPFQVKCLAAKVVSPLRKGEVVEVRRLAPEDACTSDMLVLIRWQGRNLAVPLSQLATMDAGESTTEAIGDWHYWVRAGLLFLTAGELVGARRWARM